MSTRIFVSLSALITSGLAVSAFAAPDYRKILTCGDGALVVDVDLNNPRSGQVVIRDRDALNHFIQAGAINERANRRVFNSQTARYDSAENKFEFILSGSQQNRMLSSSEFQGFQGFSTGPARGAPYDSVRFNINTRYGPFQRASMQAYVFPENGGIKVKFDEVLDSFSGCTAYISNPQGYSSDCANAGGQNVSFPPERLTDKASWFFGNCVQN